MKAVEDMPTVYLFVGRKSEATLCSEFIPVIGQSLDVFVPDVYKRQHRSAFAFGYLTYVFDGFFLNQQTHALLTLIGYDFFGRHSLVTDRQLAHVEDVYKRQV